MARKFHVTASRNRQSVEHYGLDWRRMSGVRGIAGSRQPEQEGIFLCQDEREVDWFLGFSGPGGPLDVWAVDGVDDGDLIRSPEGHLYVPYAIPPERLELVRADVPLRT